MNFLSDNINLLALLGAALTLLITIFVVSIYAKQMKVKKEGGVLTEDDWDGIKEYKNELPVGWAIMFVLLIIWALWYYLLGYPLNSFSQVGMYNEEVKEHTVKFESKYANADIDTLKQMGQGIFMVQCSQCHGLSGDGINGKAQDLTIWGSEKAIYDTIMNGSKGMNYPLGEMPAGLETEQNAKAIAAYVAKELSQIKTTENPNLVEQGKEAFVTCVACHGEDGKGMDGQAPDLTKYASSSFVNDVLNRGKSGNIGVMPNFVQDGRLNEVQIKAVSEYVNSLSKE